MEGKNNKIHRNNVISSAILIVEFRSEFFFTVFTILSKSSLIVLVNFSISFSFLPIYLWKLPIQ